MRCDLSRSFLLTLALAGATLFLPSFCTAAPQQESDKAAAQQQPAETPIDRWNQMSPEERERELAKLPPARAKMIRQRIERYNRLHPEAQQALRERYQTFSQLSPERRQVVRQRLVEFRQLPVARRPVIHREVEQMRLLPEGDRQARLNSDEFHTQFSAQEQQIIRDLSTFLPK